MATPWYTDGLRFSCTKCGNCCTGAPGYVWVEPAEIDALAAKLGVPEAEFRAMYTRSVGKGRSLREKSNGDCVFFEQGQGCTVYSARPTQCRTWPFWESTTETREDWTRTQAGCPGAGKGQFFTAEEITQRVRALRV
jgi:uncharacterized protein